MLSFVRVAVVAVSLHSDRTWTKTNSHNWQISVSLEGPTAVFRVSVNLPADMMEKMEVRGEVASGVELNRRVIMG